MCSLPIKVIMTTKRTSAFFTSVDMWRTKIYPSIQSTNYVKSSKVMTGSPYWWQTDGSFDSGCEEEEEDEVEYEDDFVLKFSTDESDCETSTSSISRNDYLNSNFTPSVSLAKSRSEISSSMKKNIQSTTGLLGCDKKLTNNIRRNVRQKNKKNITINNQRSTTDHCFSYESDGKLIKIKKDQDLDEIVNVENLINQLLTARVILERIPDSLFMKNPSHYDEYEAILQRIKRYCPSCKEGNVTFLKKNYCSGCESLILKYESSKYGNRYSLRKNLKIHQKLKSFRKTDEVYRCSKCKYSSSFKRSLKRHVKIVHKNSDSR